MSFVIRAPMGSVIDPQSSLGEQDIALIPIAAKSRHDTPRTLRGLQRIDSDAPTRERVLAILAETLSRRGPGEDTVSPDTGRPGMAQWKIPMPGIRRSGPGAWG